MAHEPYLFDGERLLDVGQMIGDSLTARLGATILALHVRTWHVHVLFTRASLTP
jgi:hypothetical protein